MLHLQPPVRRAPFRCGRSTPCAASSHRPALRYSTAPRAATAKPAGKAQAPAPEVSKPEASAKPLPPVEVVFDDFDFVFVNKPEGLVVAGLPGQVKENSYHEMVKEFVTQRYKYVPGLLHRIDKPASGLLVYGKNKEAEKYFQRIVQDNHSVVMKVYLTILCGVPKVASGLVKGGIIRTVKSKGGPRFSIVPSGGTKVVTEYQVLSEWEHPTWGQLSAVAMRAVTGRQHQLRATASALGCPILGDRRYGGKTAPRVMLHASFAGFLARVGKPYHVICPPDWDLIDASLPRCEAYLKAIPPLKKPI